KFRYRNSSNAQTRLCDSKKLLNLKSEWENDEYEDDWERYKDFKNSIKTNDKKRKREAHISFHEE
ncbi:18607_t:CDS:2, partial [Gigaspora rosea]